MLARTMVCVTLLMAAPGIARADTLADCTQVADRDKAIAACTALIKDAGKDRAKLETGYSARGAAYEAKGELRKALSDLTWALAAGPKNADLWYRRGVVRAALGQNIRAAADQTLALRYDPKNVKALIERGELYRKLGSLKYAVGDASEAIKLDPKSATAFANRGYAKLRLGDGGGAAADADEAIKLDEKSALGYLTRGLATAKTDKDKAIADVKKALELRPGMPEATSALKTLTGETKS